LIDDLEKSGKTSSKLQHGETRIHSKTTALGGDDNQKLRRPQSIHGFDTEMEDEFESEESEEEEESDKKLPTTLREGGEKEMFEGGSD